eukprot:CAMPEP_0196713790 /NCGR_PEP_ID=MMETSP1090-20130531/75389_1 /TAXON_ID=37098 /ORGANISM="Isochrysis sp, Strain CCMP1244" /LENGTH=346 /DNA_ID=CAMNT_0042053893 /DNA_START=30 /DNA_END=1070 /DNA_ORIENTATION=-
MTAGLVALSAAVLSTVAPSVFLVCSGSGGGGSEQHCPPDDWLGEYTLQLEARGDRPTYRHSTAASGRTPEMWYTPDRGWYVGAVDRLGERKAAMLSRDIAAMTPDAVTQPWLAGSWTGGNRTAAAVPGLRCLGAAEGRVAMETEAAAARAIVAAGAGTVYFAPVESDSPRFDDVRAGWVGAYRRARIPQALMRQEDPRPSGGPGSAGSEDTFRSVNQRNVYESSRPSAGGKTRALWYAGDAWFLGYRENIGQLRGVFHARSAARLPEQIGAAAWQMASRKGRGKAPGADWVAAQDLQFFSGEGGKQALSRYKAQMELRRPHSAERGRRASGGGGRRARARPAADAG